ncbi:MAG: LysR family transcriptional regulator [Burkholderiales bacterium]
MELYLLRTFVTVAEQGHLTKAATLLHVTQPAVSGQVKALEEALGLRLFERSPTGVRLTKAGEALLPRARSALAAAAEFTTNAKKLAGHLTGKARVGTILDPGVIRLGSFASTLLEHYPWLDVELAHGISTWAMECVSNGSLDAAFFMGDGLHSNVRALPLVELAYRVVAPAAWRAQIESAGWSAIAALPWIRPPRHSPHQRMQQGLFEPRKLNPATVVEADQESSISALVKAGVGLGLMRDDLALAAERAGEVCVWGGGGASTTLSFVYARDREDDGVIEALVAAVGAVWQLAAARSLPRRLRPVG